VPIEIITGDITEQEVETIVNSASPSLLAAGGVCGAIHKKAGYELERECKTIGHIDAGNAVITQGFNLKASYVIHAVAPRWLGGYNREEELLKRCYHSIFEIVEMESIKSIAIPAMAVGSYRYPLELATPIAISVAKEYDAKLDNVLIRFVCFDDKIAKCYENCL